MTRTGKSNTTKTMVSAVALSAFESDSPIGQVILDINGEYSNANNQDGGSSIADVFADNTVRYRIGSKAGFRDVRVNFYKSLELGQQFIVNNLNADGSSLNDDLKTFTNCSLTEPDRSDRSVHGQWKRRVALYQTILAEAGFNYPSNFMIEFAANKGALDKMFEHVATEEDRAACSNQDQRVAAVIRNLELTPYGDGYRVFPKVSARFWSKVRDVERAIQGGIEKAKGEKWLKPEDIGMLGVLVGRSSKTDGPIRSLNAIKSAAGDFHSEIGSPDISREIYDLLAAGRIVIVDLSVGKPSIRETMAERIARGVFDTSSAKFTSGQTAPRIVLYVEEAHNLIGKKADLNTTWPRIAKEGAKYGMSLVYATQEPSSIHPNILSNTENFFVTHLNNDDEIKTLSKYYDFEDFAPSLKRCQDVGFARIKTLSANFTTPTQIMLFDPANVGAKYNRVKSSASSWFTPLEAGA